MPKQTQQDIEAGRQFDLLAGQATALFNRIQAQSVITVADLQAAQAAYSQLAQIATLPIPYITAQWDSPNYRAAYEARLQQIASAVAVSDPAGMADLINTTDQQAATTAAGGAGDSGGLLLLLGAGVALLFLLKR